MTRNVVQVRKHPRPGKTCNALVAAGAVWKVDPVRSSIAEAAARLSVARIDSTYDIIRSLNRIRRPREVISRVRNRVGNCMQEKPLNT
jgi:hypothetical protein